MRPLLIRNPNASFPPPFILYWETGSEGIEEEEHVGKKSPNSILQDHLKGRRSEVELMTKTSFLLLFWSIWFINYSARTVFSPILPIIEEELKISHAEAGGIFGFISLGYALGLLLAGPLMGWISSRRLLIFGHGGIVLFLALFSFGHWYGYLSTLCLFLGFAAGVYLPCAIPLLTGRFSSSHWAKVIGFHGTAPSISLLIVPIIVAFLFGIVPWRMILLLFSLAGIVPLLALMRLTMSSKDSALPVKPGYATLLKNKRIWVLGILQAVVASSNLGIYAIIPLFLVSERGYTLLEANQLLGISRIGGVLVTFIVGAIADRFGYVRILMAVTTLSGIFTVLMALRTHESLLAIFLFFQTSIVVGFFPICFALASKTVEPENRGPAVAFVTLLGAVGMAITPWLLGTIADHYSFSYGISAIGVITILASFLLRAFY